MPYELSGDLLEVCTCKILCPCWVGEDPDGDFCHSLNSWHVKHGQVNGVDVSGLTFATLCDIPGNVLKGNWRIVAFVDDKATKDQEEALKNAFLGKLGGPCADLASLHGEVAAVERVPIMVDIKEGKGRITVGTEIEAEMGPYQGATGHVTTLRDTAFSTIPGSPAYVSKASRYRAKNPTLGFDIDLEGHNAIQGEFHFKL